MVDVSILLPSLREEAAAHFIDWINCQRVPYKYEIVLVAPFKIEKPNVVWLEDTGPHNGSLRPINDGYAVSRGQFISTASDDAPYDVGWWTIIDFIKKLDPRRRFRIAGYNPARLRLFKYVYKYPKLRKLPGLTKFHPQSRIHGILMPGWFCVERETVPLLGGTPFRKEFWAHCGDVDLGLKLHWAGEVVQFCRSARIICSLDINDRLHANNISKYEARDIEVLNSIWKDIYGEYKFKTLLSKLNFRS